LFLISSNFSVEVKETVQKKSDDEKKEEAPTGAVSFASLVCHRVLF
jgi:hypothetical protein